MGLVRKTWETVPATLVAETIKAVKIDFGEREVWVPKSLISNLDPFIEGDDPEIEVETWWLTENNLI